ncbi:MAG: putative ABC transporter permease, partial [Lachnospiraceae bacterium]|nr:putative ABC transporter permease [Lachnospiraceae bacterium]
DANATLEIRKLRYVRPYTIWSLILAFIFFSFVGWLWEVSLHLIKDGVFVNRGVFHGPWLPIYGGGLVMILIVLARFRKKPQVEIALIVVLCGIVEYFTSLFLELSAGMRWWDYTGYFLNLNGRICAEGLLVFALGGAAVVYLAMPLLDSLWMKLNKKILVPLCIGLLAIFRADWIYSHYVPNVGEGITDYEDFEEVEE